jgi:hypothetical protein
MAQAGGAIHVRHAGRRFRQISPRRSACCLDPRCLKRGAQAIRRPVVVAAVLRHVRYVEVDDGLDYSYTAGALNPSRLLRFLKLRPQLEGYIYRAF